MTVTSGNAGKVTRRQAAARRRRLSYDTRVRAASGERRRLHALVWWWLSEVYTLPAEERAVEVRRLEESVAALNGRWSS